MIAADRPGRGSPTAPGDRCHGDRRGEREPAVKREVRDQRDQPHQPLRHHRRDGRQRDAESDDDADRRSTSAACDGISTASIAGPIDGATGRPSVVDERST